MLQLKGPKSDLPSQTLCLVCVKSKILIWMPQKSSKKLLFLNSCWKKVHSPEANYWIISIIGHFGISTTTGIAETYLHPITLAINNLMKCILPP